MAASVESLVRVCREVVAPLVRADGGELYLVRAQPEQLTLHLAGTCSGCPGVNLTARAVIEPAIHAIAPLVRVVVTNGFSIPEGASLLG